MKKKMLLISNGFIGMASWQNFHLQEYYDIDFLPYNSNLTYDFPLPEIKNNIIQKDAAKTYMRLDNYDVIFGLDTGCLSVLSQVRVNNPQIKAKLLCQILDYPKHIFVKNKNFSQQGKDSWEKKWCLQMTYVDGLMFNQEESLLLAFNDYKYLSKIKSTINKFPIRPLPVEEYERKNFVLYIGRYSPDKGVYNLINSLSLIENAPKLITICTNPQSSFEKFAEYLKVDYENIENCSEQDKWKYLHECLFTVHAGDAYMIPPLMITEGLSIGRSSVCYDYPEYRKTFYKNVEYVKPYDLKSFAEKIDWGRKEIDFFDDRAKKSQDWYLKNRSYEAWAKNCRDFIEEL